MVLRDPQMHMYPLSKFHFKIEFAVQELSGGGGGGFKGPPFGQVVGQKHPG